MHAVKLPPDFEARLDARAKKMGHSKSGYVREVLMQHLEDLEDLEDAEKALEDIRSGKVKTIPLEEVMKRYGMVD